ncbi:MAG: hypothetical protein QME66_12730 [Candidatus Eisenbacteria bacterium]|nr:hypothetical protein [Candidatus Eisenbacteria bacterium]
MRLVPALMLIIVSGCSVFRGAADHSLYEQLLLSNLRETPYTAHIKIARVEKNREILSDSGELGYVVFKVQAEVIETYKGDKYSTIEYFVFREAPSEGPPVGENLIVSLRRSEEGDYYVSDNGYELPATESLIRLARSKTKQS